MKIHTDNELAKELRKRATELVTIHIDTKIPATSRTISVYWSKLDGILSFNTLIQNHNQPNAVEACHARELSKAVAYAVE